MTSTPPAACPDGDVEVSWEVATDERFRRVVRRGRTLARPELAHSVHVDAVGLEPAREYFYRFRALGELSPVGRTRTAPAPWDNPRSLRFGDRQLPGLPERLLARVLAPGR